MGYKIKLAKVACVFGMITRRDLRVSGLLFCKILVYKKCVLGSGPLRDI